MNPDTPTAALNSLLLQLVSEDHARATVLAAWRTWVREQEAAALKKPCDYHTGYAGYCERDSVALFEGRWYCPRHLPIRDVADARKAAAS